MTRNSTKAAGISPCRRAAAPSYFASWEGVPGDELLFELLVTGIGGATEDVVTDAIEHILRNASENTELKVD